MIYRVDMLYLLLQVEPGTGVLLRSEKIYSVLTVLLLIFAGITIYLLLLNRKTKRLEQRMQELENHE